MNDEQALREELHALDAKSRNEQASTDDLRRAGEICRQLNLPERALEYLKQAIQTASADERIDLLRSQGKLQQSTGDTSASRDSFLEALAIAESTGNKEILGQLYLEMGSLMRQITDYDESLEMFLKAERVFTELGNHLAVASADSGIGSVYWRIGRPNEAVTHLEHARELLEKYGGKLALTRILNNLAVIYLDIHQTEKALTLFLSCYDIMRDQDNPNNQASTLNNIGKALAELERHDEALAAYQESLSIYLGLKHLWGIANGWSNISELYLRQGNHVLCLFYLSRSLSLAESINAKDLMLENNLYFSRLFEARGDLTRALASHKRYSELKAEIFSEESDRRLTEMQARFQTERKTREAEIYRLRNVELKEAYDSLQTAHKEIIELERRNSVLAMVVTANHEINQPLQILRSNLELLAVRNTADWQMDNTRYLEHMHSSIDRICDILARFRNAERLDTVEYADDTQMFTFEQPKTD